MTGTPDRPELTAGAPAAVETEAERVLRLAYEAELVARGRADVAAGRVVPGEAVEAWVSESVRLGWPAERPRAQRHSAERAG